MDNKKDIIEELLKKFIEKELGEDYKVFYEKSMYNHNEKI